MDQVLAFDGTLDLSNTEVTDLTGIAYLENLTGIDLSGSSIEKITGLSGLANLREISHYRLRQAPNPGPEQHSLWSGSPAQMPRS